MDIGGRFRGRNDVRQINFFLARPRRMRVEEMKWSEVHAGVLRGLNGKLNDVY